MEVEKVDARDRRTGGGGHGGWMIWSAEVWTGNARQLSQLRTVVT